MAADEPRAPAANAHCPRCGGGFHCGAKEARCDCQQLQLDEALRGELRRSFEGCLCVACLRALQAEHGARPR